MPQRRSRSEMRSRTPVTLALTAAMPRRSVVVLVRLDMCSRGSSPRTAPTAGPACWLDALNDVVADPAGDRVVREIMVCVARRDRRRRPWSSASQLSEALHLAPRAGAIKSLGAQPAAATKLPRCVVLSSNAEMALRPATSAHGGQHREMGPGLNLTLTVHAAGGVLAA